MDCKSATTQNDRPAHAVIPVGVLNAMAALNVKRAAKEFSQLQASVGKPEGAHLAAVDLLNEDDVLTWRVALRGPPNSPYAGGTFRAIVTIGADYPHRDPTVRFETQLVHPGVTAEGKLCEKLFSDWAPTMGVKDALVRIVKMLAAPADYAFVNDDVAKLFMENRAAFEQKAAHDTKKYAK
jgi:ubiquitin-conjugating enzyme E2 D/E